MDVKVLNISLPAKLLEIIDAQAKLNYATRSEYIKTTLINRLKSDGVLNNSMIHTPQTLAEARKTQLKAMLKSIGYDTEAHYASGDGDGGATQQHAGAP